MPNTVCTYGFMDDAGDVTIRGVTVPAEVDVAAVQTFALGLSAYSDCLVSKVAIELKIEENPVGPWPGVTHCERIGYVKVKDLDSGRTWALPASAVSALCAMLPPPLNMLVVLVVQIGLRILDSKLEAASNREMLASLEGILGEIRDVLDGGLLSPSESLEDRQPLIGRLLDIQAECSVDDYGAFRRLLLSFDGATDVGP